MKYDDLQFIIEKCIDWKELSSIRGKDFSADELIMSLKTIAQFCDNQVEPVAEEVDSEGCCLNVSSGGIKEICIPDAMKRNLQSLIDLGFFCGVTFPEEAGGYDLPMTSFFAIGELLSMSDGSIGLSPMLQEGCGQVIAEFANEAIKKEYLPVLMSGERICSMGLTEPGAGSDLAVMQTYAEKAGPGDDSPRLKELRALGEVYLVSGTKIFITNGFGDVLTLAKTPEGISMFLVYQQDKTIARVEKKLGIKGSPTCEIFYDKSPGVLIGRLGDGLVPNMMKLMHIARLGVATQGLGLAQKAHELAVNYATNDRVQFGKKIAELPPVRQILFEDEIDLQASRILTYTACYYFDLVEATKAAMKKRPCASLRYLFPWRSTTHPSWRTGSPTTRRRCTADTDSPRSIRSSGFTGTPGLRASTRERARSRSNRSSTKPIISTSSASSTSTSSAAKKDLSKTKRTGFFSTICLMNIKKRYRIFHRAGRALGRCSSASTG
jgi:alkylation response protein AidB-like acyl-CoA dehydrogenase